MSDSNDKLDANVRRILDYLMQPKRRNSFLICLTLIDVAILFFRTAWVAPVTLEGFLTVVAGILVHVYIVGAWLSNWSGRGIKKYSPNIEFSHAFVRLALIVFYVVLGVSYFQFGSLK